MMERLKKIATSAEMMAVAGLVAMRRHIEMGQEADRRICFIAAGRGIAEEAAEAQYGEMIEYSRRSLFSVDECWLVYAPYLLGGMAHELCMSAIEEKHRRRFHFGMD